MWQAALHGAHFCSTFDGGVTVMDVHGSGDVLVGTFSLVSGFKDEADLLAILTVVNTVEHMHGFVVTDVQVRRVHGGRRALDYVWIYRAADAPAATAIRKATPPAALPARAGRCRGILAAMRGIVPRAVARVRGCFARAPSPENASVSVLASRVQAVYARAHSARLLADADVAQLSLIIGAGCGGSEWDVDVASIESAVPRGGARLAWAVDVDVFSLIPIAKWVAASSAGIQSVRFDPKTARILLTCRGVEAETEDVRAPLVRDEHLRR